MPVSTNEGKNEKSKTKPETKTKAETKAKAKGKARYVAPILASCVGLLLALLLMFPMLKMQPRNVPVGILSLDQGIEFNDTFVDVGDIVVDELTEQPVSLPEGLEGITLISSSEAEDDAHGESDDEQQTATQSGYVSSDAVNWIVADNAEQLQEMLEAGEVYAAMTIPEGFSRTIVANAGRSEIGAQLVEKLPDITAGANALAEGTASLEQGSQALTGGVSQLSSGTSLLEGGVSGLPAAAESAKNGADSLKDGLVKLEAGAQGLETGAASLESAAGQMQQAIQAAMASLSSGSPDAQRAMALLAAANQGAEKMKEGASGLSSGASNLADGLAATATGASALSSGLGQLSDSAPALVSGMGSLANGVSSLEDGATKLSSGATALYGGSSTLASGLDAANEALLQLPSETSDSQIKLVINQGKNPMVSNSLGSAISSLGASSGMSFDISYINPLPSEMSMGFTHMILMIMTYISSYATAAVIANVLKTRRGKAGKVIGSLALQAGYALICALLIGVGVAGILKLTIGVSRAFSDIALFVAVASFTFQMLVLGSIDLFGMAGMAVPIGLLIIGMGTAYLPTEFLPAFWQDWVYPWDPLRFMVDGFRGILYMGDGWWNAATPVLLVVAAIGIVLMVICAILNIRKKGSGESHVAKKHQELQTT